MEIYSAKLTFKKIKGIIIVEIRRTKYEKPIKEKINIPEEIDLRDLQHQWIRYRGEGIIVYHRKMRGDRYVYIDSKHLIASEIMGNKLEKIVNDVLLKLYQYDIEVQKKDFYDYFKFNQK